MKKIKEQTEISLNNTTQNFKRDKIQNRNSSLPNHHKEMYRDYFHWGAITEIMGIIRSRRKSPETLQLGERRLEISRPGAMRRRYDTNALQTIWVPSRLNKRSREEIAEIDGELLNRANRLGGGYCQ